MILVAFYAIVVVLGIVSMGFQLLASRLLFPHFGSGIDVWAWLISTFLAAFSSGSMLGGWLSSRGSPARERAQVILAVVGLVALGFTAFFGRAVLGTLGMIESIYLGLALSCLGLFFVPITAISAFGPLNVQFLASRGRAPGAASGTVYGVSTLGNIAGVMLTSLILIPEYGVSVIIYAWLVVSIFSLTCLIAILRTVPRSSAA